MNISELNYLISMKTIVFSILVALFSNNIQAQSNSTTTNSNFWNHVRFGGGIGLSFGDGYFSGTVAPSAIYQFDDKFALGLGLSGSYYKRKNLYKSTVFGGSVIGLFNPIREIQLSSEFELLHVDRNFDQTPIGTSGSIDDNYWYSALFLGAGYRSGNFTIGIRYDVLYDEDKSIYADPWIPFIRVYF